MDPTCPQCKKGFRLRASGITTNEADDAKKHFPFCSERCRLLDLDSWLTGRYALPAVDQESESDDES